MPGEGTAGKKGADGEAEATGRNPTGRGKSGTKRRLLTEGRGVPTALLIAGANRTAMKKLAELLDAVVDAVVIARPAAALEEHLCLDREYDYDTCREAATARGYRVHIPPTASAAQPLPAPGDPERHPPRRWVVENFNAWLAPTLVVSEDGEVLQIVVPTSFIKMWLATRLCGRDARCAMRDARCAMRDARCAMRDARCAMRDARCAVPGGVCGVARGVHRPGCGVRLPPDRGLAVACVHASLRH